jgi:hypothetical protein
LPGGKTQIPWGCAGFVKQTWDIHGAAGSGAQGRPSGSDKQARQAKTETTKLTRRGETKRCAQAFNLKASLNAQLPFVCSPGSLDEPSKIVGMRKDSYP